MESENGPEDFSCGFKGCMSLKISAFFSTFKCIVDNVTSNFKLTSSHLFSDKISLDTFLGNLQTSVYMNDLSSKRPN